MATWLTLAALLASCGETDDTGPTPETIDGGGDVVTVFVFAENEVEASNYESFVARFQDDTGIRVELEVRRP